MRKVVIHLALHAIDLLPDGGADVRLARALGRGGFLQEDRQRCLQGVRQVAGFGLRAFNDLVALIQQRVEIVHERLHF
jgi:hypothetical protein